MTIIKMSLPYSIYLIQTCIIYLDYIQPIKHN